MHSPFKRSSSEIVLDHTISYRFVILNAHIYTLSGCQFDIHHFDLGDPRVRGKSKLLGFNKSKIVFKGSDGIFDYVAEVSLVGGVVRDIIFIIIGDATCDGHQEHLETNQSVLDIVRSTSREEIISRLL
jgi:hypothetical protein